MNRNVVLMYHDIVTMSDKSSGFQNESAFMYKVDATIFEKQVKDAKDNVTFTFDDGGFSFLTLAAPILEKYRKRGVFFISTKYIDTPGFLSREQIIELSKRGHVIGSHSHSHPSNMAVLSKDELLFEWKESVRILSNILGRPVSIASIPNGYDSKEVIDTAIATGITELHTSRPTMDVDVRKGCKVVGRYVIHDKMSNDYVSSIIQDSTVRRKLYWRWQAINLIKLLLGNSYNRVKMLIRRKKY